MNSDEDPVNEESMRLIAEGACTAVIPIGAAIRKKRSPNWFGFEDLMVAKAYVNVSMDTTVGNNQSAATFWKRVQQKFMVQFHAHVISVDGLDSGVKDHGGRTALQIENRFMKVMKMDVTQFNKYFKEIADENPSGVPYKQHMKLTQMRYNHKTKEPFRFLHCVPTLHKCPKFKPLDNTKSVMRAGIPVYGIEDQEEFGKETTQVNIMMGADMVRPQGRKAAKSQLKTDKRRSHYSSTNSSSQVKLEEVKVDEVEAPIEERKLQAAVFMAESIAAMSKSMDYNGYFDRMERLIKMSRDEGNHMIADLKHLELQAFMVRDHNRMMVAATPLMEAAKVSSNLGN